MPPSVVRRSPFHTADQFEGESLSYIHAHAMDEELSSTSAVAAPARKKESSRSHPDAPVSFDATVGEATIRLLRIVLAFGLGNSFASFAVAGLSGGSALTLILGGAWLLLWSVAVAIPSAVAPLLRDHAPSFIAVTCAVSSATILLTGGFDSFLKTEANWLVWAATVVLSTRAVLAIASALSTSLLVSLLVTGMAPSDIVTGPDSYTAVTDILNPFVIALVALALTGVFRGLFVRVPTLLSEMRVGGPSGDGLTALIAGRQLLALPTGDCSKVDIQPDHLSDLLTPAEAAIVDLLARGRKPKQIAFETHRSVHTIYDHIANAKNKTGARSLPQLITRSWRPPAT